MPLPFDLRGLLVHSLSVFARRKDHEDGAMEIARDVDVADNLLVARGPLLLPEHRCVKCGSTEPGGALHQEIVNYVHPFVWLTLFISGIVTLIAYMHDPPRLWYYPLYVANGWIDVYGVLENAYCSIANSRTEAELLSAKNFGQTSLNEIKARLEERGLSMKDSPY